MSQIPGYSCFFFSRGHRDMFMCTLWNGIQGRGHSWLSDLGVCHWLLRYFKTQSSNFWIKGIFPRDFINFFTFSWQWPPPTSEISTTGLNWFWKIFHFLPNLPGCRLRALACLITPTVTIVWQGVHHWVVCSQFNASRTPLNRFQCT